MTLTEKVARGICKSRTGKGVGCCEWPSNAGERHKCNVLDGFTNGAKAAIAIVLEEAAKVVDDYASVISDWEKYQPNNSNTHGLTVADVAISIRALAEDKE